MVGSLAHDTDPMRARFQPSLRLGSLLVAVPIVAASAWPTGADAAALSFPITQSDPARLEAGLASVEIEAIRKDLTYIASDELAGRDTPSPGQHTAARFIAKRLADLEFEAGAPDGYLYTYPLIWRQIDAPNSQVTLGKGDVNVMLTYGEDYFFDRRSELQDLTVSGELVSVGEGRSDDFEEASVSGKWALCYQTGASMRRVARRAQGAGALGLVVVPAADYSGKSYERAFGSTTRGLGKGSVSYFRKFSSDDAVFPKFYLSESGRELFSGVVGEGPFEAGAAIGVSVTERRRMTHPRAYRDFENVAGLWRGSDPELSNEVI